MEEKIDETEVEVNKPSSEGQFIFHRELAPVREINVFDVKNVYRSQAEIDRDIKRGKFKIEKTFSRDAQGNLFFLCYDHELKKT